MRGRRGRRSTQGVATTLAPKPAARWVTDSSAMSTGDAASTRIAVNGSAVRVTSEPKSDTVCAAHSHPKAGLPARRPRMAPSQAPGASLCNAGRPHRGESVRQAAGRRIGLLDTLRAGSAAARRRRRNAIHESPATRSTSTARAASVATNAMGASGPNRSVSVTLGATGGMPAGIIALHLLVPTARMDRARALPTAVASPCSSTPGAVSGTVGTGVPHESDTLPTRALAAGKAPVAPGLRTRVDDDLERVEPRPGGRRVTAPVLVAAALYGVPAVVWAIITRQMWWYARLRRPTSLGFRLMPLVGGAFVLHYGLLVALVLTPSEPPMDPWEQVNLHHELGSEITWLLIISLGRHLIHLMPIPERRPSAAWLAVNYGLAALGAVCDAWIRLLPASSPAAHIGAHPVFETAFTLLVLLALVDLWRAARPGRWGPEHAGEIRDPDVLMIVSGTLAVLMVVPVLESTGHRGLGFLFCEVALGLTLAMPFAIRMLSVVITQFVITFTLLCFGGVVLAARASALARAGASWGPFLDVATLLVLGTTFVIGPVWLRALLPRALSRRQDSQTALLEFVHTLSPRRGLQGC